MATHQDLLDAIARIRTATGDPHSWTAGLSGEDIAVATNPLSTPTALGAVMAKVIAAHPDSFLSGPLPSAQGPNQSQSQGQGAAAEAIRAAGTALGQQKSTAAQVDLQVLTAVLNAHSTHADGVAALDRLQREIEDAAAARADLDTPAGARAFQRYLVDRLHAIRAVVETAGLDSASKAALAAALANLYTASTAEPVAGASNQTSAGQDPAPRTTGADEDFDDSEGAGPDRGGEPVAPLEWAPDPLPAFGEDLGPPWPHDPVSAPAMQAIPATSTPPVAPPAAGWGGGFPTAAPFGGGMPAPAMSSLPNFDTDRPMELTDGPRRESGGSAVDEPEPVPDEVSEDADPDEPDDGATVVLPGGETVVAPSPELAAVITAALAGTPIPEAFRQQDITIPEPGTALAVALDVAQLVPGDIGLLTDRHALVLGNGTVLLDHQIQPIASVTAQGFLGWLHPPQPQPEPMPTVPEPPAPIPSAETAPS